MISIIGAQYIGLAGVYAGTVISGVLANLIRPVIIYHDCFSQHVRSYFMDSFKYICTILGIVIVLIPIKNIVLAQVSLPAFIVMAAVITVVYNLIFLCLFRKTDEFVYLQNWVMGKIKRTGK